MTVEPPLYEEVLAFWKAVGPDRWFKAEYALDQEIRIRFETLQQAAARGELDDWAQRPDGALALVLLLDQFPRNIYRNSRRAFASDAKAREVAERALRAGFDHAVDYELRPFFYLPFEHSESMADQTRCMMLTQQHGDPETHKWAAVHREVIRRFGRFPHRNAVLGRESTADELKFLAEGGFDG